ncbi:MAG: hypothetical protein ACRCV9_16325 [Burkholderiaceae bacterium]
MLAILSALLGFAGPFVPEFIKLFRQKNDNAHELKVLELQLQAAAQQHMWRMEEISSQADIAEMQTLREPQHSFGVQLLDAAAHWPKLWIIPVFYFFALLDWINGIVRPGVTVCMVGFYLWFKAAQFELAKIRMGDYAQAVVSIWTDNDFAVLMLCLGYYFGHRTMKAVFGGSANTSKPGH